MLSSEQNPEECDARDDDSSTVAGYINTLFLLPGNLLETIKEQGLIPAVILLLNLKYEQYQII
jgi:hypothetical protein